MLNKIPIRAEKIYLAKKNPGYIHFLHYVRIAKLKIIQQY